jgi:hypothetical protein
MDITMNSETIVSTPRDEEISYIAEGSLRCAWQTTDGALICRWNWAALRGEDDAESDAVAA